MILDHLGNWKCYASLNAGFEKAFEFLQRADLAELEGGRHELDGDRLYVVVIRDDGRGREGVKLEAHMKYIDIQFCLSGTDEMGWKSVALCTGRAQFDESKDVEIITDRPETWLTVPSGTFAIFFPQDAHAPQGGTGRLHKIVVKVADAP